MVGGILEEVAVGKVVEGILEDTVEDTVEAFEGILEEVVGGKVAEEDTLEVAVVANEGDTPGAVASFP